MRTEAVELPVRLLELLGLMMVSLLVQEEDAISNVGWF